MSDFPNPEHRFQFRVVTGGTIQMYGDEGRTAYREWAGKCRSMREKGVLGILPSLQRREHLGEKVPSGEDEWGPWADWNEDRKVFVAPPSPSPIDVPVDELFGPAVERGPGEEDPLADLLTQSDD